MFLFKLSYRVWFCGMVLIHVPVSGLLAFRLAYYLIYGLAARVVAQVCFLCVSAHRSFCFSLLL